jgi:hypothetical protein
MHVNRSNNHVLSLLPMWNNQSLPLEQSTHLSETINSPTWNNDDNGGRIRVAAAATIKGDGEGGR